LENEDFGKEKDVECNTK